MVALTETLSSPKIPDVKGIPFIGNTLEMAKDPAAFFVRAYRDYGPIYRVNVFGRKQYVIAGTEAAKLMSTKQGREGLRSKEFWDDFVKHYGASKTLTQIDGEEHRRMRGIMRRGFSPVAVEGRYHELAEIADLSMVRDWKIGSSVPVVEAFQYMIVHMIGEIMSGDAPLEYVKDIRTNILFLLNILVSRQRPRFLMHSPRFKKASKRVEELGDKLIAQFRDYAETGRRRRHTVTRRCSTTPALSCRQPAALKLRLRPNQPLTQTSFFQSKRYGLSSNSCGIDFGGGSSIRYSD